MPAGGWTEAWLQDSNARWSILRMPGCQRSAALLPQPTVRPGGGVDFMISVTRLFPGAWRWCRDMKPLSTETHGCWRMSRPQTKPYAAPYLSDDGTQAGWVLAIPDTGPPVLEHL